MHHWVEDYCQIQHPNRRSSRIFLEVKIAVNIFTICMQGMSATIMPIYGQKSSVEETKQRRVPEMKYAEWTGTNEMVQQYIKQVHEAGNSVHGIALP